MSLQSENRTEPCKCKPTASTSSSLLNAANLLPWHLFSVLCSGHHLWAETLTGSAFLQKHLRQHSKLHRWIIGQASWLFQHQQPALRNAELWAQALLPVQVCRHTGQLPAPQLGTRAGETSRQGHPSYCWCGHSSLQTPFCVQEPSSWGQGSAVPALLPGALGRAQQLLRSPLLQRQPDGVLCCAGPLCSRRWPSQLTSAF